MGAYGNTRYASKSIATGTASYILTVRSTPITGIEISGSLPGVTNYTEECEGEQTVILAAPHEYDLQITGTTDYITTCDDGAQVILAAPSVATADATEFRFVRWLIDDQPQPRGDRDIELTVTADHTVEAVYNLAGDATGDCTVGEHDLIFIRNRLGRNVSTDDDERADVNNDGHIDILDLVYARNRLGRSCD